MRTLGTVASLKWAFRGSSAATAWAALLDSLQSETDGMVLYFTDPDYPRALIRDTTTPANSKDVDANSVLTYTSPALKNVMGADGLVKYVNHNLLLQSQTFQTTWTNSGTTESVNAIAAPDGTTTADKIIEDSANSPHRMQQNITSVTGMTYVFSVYAKAAERNWIYLYDDISNDYVYFDLTNGVVGTTEAGWSGATITSFGNGWYKISARATEASGGSSSQLIGIASADNTPTYLGDGASGLYIWGAELKAYPVHDSGTLSDYVPTTTAARYRLPIEYDTAGDPVGLLVEEARTNLCLQSNAIQTSPWAADAVTTTGNVIVAPDGTTTGTRVLETAATSQHNQFQAITLVAATVYTWSVYAKGGLGRDWVAIDAFDGAARVSYFNITNGTTGNNAAGNTSTITDVGNGWYRCTVTRTAGGTGGYIQCNIASANGSVNYLGDIAKGAYFWGAQVEAGAFATSLIRTTSATVTRAADNISLATSAMPYSATAGTMVASAKAYNATSVTNGGGSPRVVSISNGTGDEVVTFVRAASTNLATYFVQDGGVAQAGDIALAAWANGTTKKIAGAWAANDLAASFDGGAVDTDASATLPTVNTLHIGYQVTVGYWGGHIKYIKYLPRRVANADLQTETA